MDDTRQSCKATLNRGGCGNFFRHPQSSNQMQASLVLSIQTHAQAIYHHPPRETCPTLFITYFHAWLPLLNRDTFHFHLRPSTTHHHAVGSYFLMNCWVMFCLMRCCSLHSAESGHTSGPQGNMITFTWKRATCLYAPLQFQRQAYICRGAGVRNRQ